MADEALANWLRLTLIPGIGGRTQRKLLAEFGLPEAIFAAGYRALCTVTDDKTARLLLETDTASEVAQAQAWATGDHQCIITLADPEYPRALLEIPDPPTLLYVRGRTDLLSRPAIAIVGSRNPTPQGILNAESFAASLNESGLVIVSGLALGIDAAAHRGALAAQGNTIAFIGTGIDRTYPARNQELAHEIGTKGTIVSDFPIGTPAIASNFPRRNRMISGISRGVLVVEAAVESGSLITARLAVEQGRDVFAIPGSIHSPQAKGCHKLIKQGAKLVETAQDILEELGWTAQFPQGITTTATPVQDSDHLPDRQKLLLQMGFDPCRLDDLLARSGLPADVLSVLLLHLELEGTIASLPGNCYQQLRK